MTRIGKLQDKMLRGGSLSFAEFERLLAAYGFVLDRVKGSHHIFKHPGIADRINAQPDGKSAKPYQVRQFVVIVEANGLSLDDKA
ncbi:type II toxin-antitoxin system HicA family toxin [Blastomonas sp. AAP53]|uniref:type II toxin-antitoxin system HicA family toxin n=1 Tax=Blastomonas sp. AAP53 TaxID=1248760 RepID=UPI0002D9611E|nr:type II toxin-antitoxin system HicA family toxin [Blastomonas sp. AAP53]